MSSVKGIFLILHLAFTCFSFITIAIVPSLIGFIAVRFIVGKRLTQVALRRYVDSVQQLYIRQIPAILEMCFGTRIFVSGHISERRTDSILVIANHRTRLDWLFLWHYVVRYLDPSLQKIALKRQIERVPLLGLAVHLINFLYIERDWSKDERRMTASFDYWSAAEHDTQLLIFPEGTDYTPSNVAKSNAHCAWENKLNYRHVLAPRSTGFAHCLAAGQESGLFRSVVDITIAYKGVAGYDDVPQTESALLYGALPREIHFNVRHFDVPAEESAEFLEYIWRGKDDLLAQFAERGSFTGSRLALPLSPWDRMLPFFWFALSASMIWLSFSDGVLLSWMILCFVFIVVIFPRWPLDIAHWEQRLFE